MRRDVEVRIARVLTSETSEFVSLVRLADLDPAVSFRHADLSDIDFSFQDLTGFNFEGATFDGSKFSGAKISRANFASSNITRDQLFQSVDWARSVGQHELFSFDVVRQSSVMDAKNIGAILRSIHDEKSFAIAVKKLSDIAAGGRALGERVIVSLLDAAPTFALAWSVMMVPELTPETVADPPVAKLIKMAPSPIEAFHVFESFNELLDQKTLSARALMKKSAEFDFRKTVLLRMLEDGMNVRGKDVGAAVRVAKEVAQVRDLSEEMYGRFGYRIAVSSIGTFIQRCKTARDVLGIIDVAKKLGYHPPNAYYARAIALADDIREAQSILDRMRTDDRAPDVQCYEALMLHAENVQMGQDIMSHIRDSGLRPTENSYAHLVRLDRDFRSGLAHLDEVRRVGMSPTAITYRAIVDRAETDTELRYVLHLMLEEGVFFTSAFCKAALRKASIGMIGPVLEDLLAGPRGVPDERLVDYAGRQARRLER